MKNIIPSDWVDTHAYLRARLLRRLGVELSTTILPHLGEGEAAEMAIFSTLLANRLASEDDLVPEMSQSFNPRFADEAAAAVELIGRLGNSVAAGDLRESLQRASATGVRLGDRSRMLRGIVALAIRHLSSFDTDESRSRLFSIAKLDRAWCDARTEKNEGDLESPSLESIVPVDVRVDVASISAYLGRCFPKDTHGQVRSVRRLPGGRSKITTFIDLEGFSELPSKIVMRQDGPSAIETSVVDEYPLLLSLGKAGLPIPEPLLLESDTAEFGGAFMFVRHLTGKQAGSFFGFDTVDDKIFIETAQVLAQLHCIDAQGSVFRSQIRSGHLAESLATNIDAHEVMWREEAIEPSPLIDYAFSWIRRNLGFLPDASSIVHGDYRPHNFLVDDDRLIGLLDWEFTHLGDPAEDLAYFRPIISEKMDWNEFMTAYRNAGGKDHAEETLIFYEIWNAVRLAAVGAGGTSRFSNGVTNDLCQGIGGYFVMPLHEANISQALRRAEAIGLP